MNRLKALRNRMAALREQMEKILATAEAAGTSNLTEDQQKEFDALTAEAATVAKSIEREESLAEIERRLGTVPDANEQATRAARDRANDAASGQAPRFASLGEQMAAVRLAGVTGERDPRLQFQAAATGMGETTPSDGGFLVQSDFLNELADGMFTTGEILRRLPPAIEIGPNSNKLTVNQIQNTNRATGYRGGAMSVAWAGENTTPTAGLPKFVQQETLLRKVIGLLYATEELLEDASAITGVINEAFRQEMTFTLEDAIVNGTGAGQPMGILNAPCLVSQAKETGQEATTLLTENIVKMWSRLLPKSQTGGSTVWLCNQDISAQLLMAYIANGTAGSPVFMPPGGLSASPYSTILGKPLLPTEYNATLGTVGDLIAADLSFYRWITKGGIKSANSIHVRFIYDEQAFRFTMRVGGQPKLATYVTPYKGSSNTQSPFVALATRS